jgi:predicted PurR-regulated permease PerM
VVSSAARRRGRRGVRARLAGSRLTGPEERAALEEDGLLLDDDAQRLAAHASEEQPFGRPGEALGQRSAVRRGFSVTAGGLLAVGLALAVREVASELLLVVVAAFIAIGLEPVVGWLVGHGLRRALAVTLIVVAVLAGLVAFLAAAVPPIVSEATQLVEHAPDYLQQLQDKHTTIGRLNASWHLVERARSLAASSLSVSSFGGLLSVGAVVVSYSFQLVIVLVLSVYFLADFPNIKRAMYRLAPLPRRPRVGLLGDAVIARTGGYVLGNLFTSLIATVAQYVTLRVLGVPFALALAVLVGVFDLVPLVGSTLAGVVVTLVALATVSTTAAVVNAVFSVVYRLAEDYVLSPRILARTVDVKPAVVIIAVMLGGGLLGIEGALIAVPVAAALQLLVTEVVYPRADGGEPPI